MNPKPLLRPVSRSNITVESTTFPNCEKNSRIESEVTVPAKPPMKSLVARWCSWRGIARLGSIYNFDIFINNKFMMGLLKLRTILPSRKCSLTMTALTLAGSSNVKNAKHLERPAASRMIVHASTFPNCSKYVRSDSTNKALLLVLLYL